MKRKMVKEVSKKSENFQFQVGCMSLLTLKQDKASKEKIEVTFASTFDALKPQQLRKVI